MPEPDHDTLERLLHAPLLQPPPGFAQRVLLQLPQRAAAPIQHTQHMQHPLLSRLRWLLAATGLVGGGALGLSQLGSFVFGLWLGAAAI